MKRRQLLIFFTAVFALFVAGKVVSENIHKQVDYNNSFKEDSIKQVSLHTAENVFQQLSGKKESTLEVECLIKYALSFIGIPYYYTGKNPETGFDCSGFTSFVFKHFGYNVSPASREQINAGRPVKAENIQKGDLLIFTGTNVSLREPGHVGIVISTDHDQIQFIHSSSNRHKWGVTVSSLGELSYSKRFIQARRILD
jgi:cell wall-associated NlpC family hydrolase